MTYNEIMSKIKVGLALGVGGACGVAHLGFLQALEESGIKVDMIAGASMGAIIGGLYASGVSLEELESLSKSLTKGDIIELNVFKILKEGLFTGKRLEKYLSEHLKCKNIEDTKIKFVAQATDIKTGKIKVFEEGSMVDALRASSAIPGIFTPVYKDNTCYIDGGAVEPVPFRILKERDMDVVIAVNCLSDYKDEQTPKNTFNILIDSMNLMIDNTWKNDKEKYKDYYDIYCFDGLEDVNPVSIDIESISRSIAYGKTIGFKYADEIKKIIEEKKKYKCKN